MTFLKSPNWKHEIAQKLWYFSEKPPKVPINKTFIFLIHNYTAMFYIKIE
jgi:hypothetical protein